MFPSPILLRFTLVLLTCTYVAGLSGCGAPEEEAASAPKVKEAPAEAAAEFQAAPEHISDDWNPNNLPESVATGEEAVPPRPETPLVPFKLEAAPPRMAEVDAAPTSSPASVPKMAVRSHEPEAALRMTPRMAPMALAPATEPEPARMTADRSVAPRMAEMSPAPSAVETAPEPMAMPMEMAAPPELAEETPSVARTPVAENRGEYEAVTVFFGTDRSSNATSGQPDQPHRLWLYAAGVGILLCGLFALVAALSSRRKTFASLAVMSFSAGSVMAVMGAIAWLQSDAAVAGPELEYGNGRGKFVMGTCEVSIPRNHQVAVLEAPSVFKLDFVEDPTKHVMLLDIEEEDSETFFSQVRDRVDRSAAKDAFVFVHGFNVTFKDAARRTAQLTYDLKFQGAPIFYSWPSQGGLFKYAVDETNVVWTVPHLQEFLKEIAAQSGAKSVHLIAHSMGNRALTSALRELSLEMRGQPPLFHEVVLTAPDIDREIFCRDIAPAIVSTAKRVTLYASSNDQALVLSKQVHGYPRAGDTGNDLVVIDGIETIDVSAVDTSLLGHNYYGDNATVISDMIDLVRNSKSAGERSWLEMTPLDNLFYWVFRPDRAAVGAASTETRPRY